MSTSPPPEAISLRAAAVELGVHENTVRRWIDRGLLDAEVLPSGTRRLRTRDVLALRRDAVPTKLHRLVADQGRPGLTLHELARFELFESEQEVADFIALTRAARDTG